ncbi:hypothetical protein Pen01_68330 [Phytomonospora endophytica]|nr:hypothetical protein Pen01_68330 [Phytomonospora endophytica]
MRLRRTVRDLFGPETTRVGEGSSPVGGGSGSREGEGQGVGTVACAEFAVDANRAGFGDPALGQVGAELVVGVKDECQALPTSPDARLTDRIEPARRRDNCIVDSASVDYRSKSPTAHWCVRPRQVAASVVRTG